MIKAAKLQEKIDHNNVLRVLAVGMCLSSQGKGAPGSYWGELAVAQTSGSVLTCHSAGSQSVGSAMCLRRSKQHNGNKGHRTQRRFVCIVVSRVSSVPLLLAH